MNYILLLPPSERKNPGGRGIWSSDNGVFGNSLCTPREKILSNLLDTVIPLPKGAVYPNLVSLPLEQRYNGVVWKQLNYNTFNKTMNIRAKKCLLVPSALGGLFAWGDPVPEYKLKLGASLSELGRLNLFWREHISKEIQNSLEEKKSNTVIDLLAQEQAVSVTLPANIQRISVDFFSFTGKLSGHNSKAAKGMLARALLESDDPIEVINTWSHYDASGKPLIKAILR
jgi:hypothetical protein